MRLASMANMHMSCHPCTNPFHATDVVNSSFGRNFSLEGFSMGGGSISWKGGWEFSMARAKKKKKKRHRYDTQIDTGPVPLSPFFLAPCMELQSQCQEEYCYLTMLSSRGGFARYGRGGSKACHRPDVCSIEVKCRQN
jgi:hypothetical protein